MNDEDVAHPNQFRVWVLRRGTLVEHGNPFLSPYFPTVEDLASGS
jgi:Immunity protein 7